VHASQSWRGIDLDSKFLELHASNGISVFQKALEIIQNEKVDSIEHISAVLEELSMYEREIQKIMEMIFDSTYSRIVSALIEPVDEYFEEEYEEH
jgi:hypothetical protein